MKNFVQSKGQQIYFAGKPLRLRGLGVGSWLNMEHFMLGIPTPHSMIHDAFCEVYGKENAESFFQNFRESFLQEEDFRLLKDIGINFLRVPLNHRMLLCEQSGEYLESGFTVLKNLLDLGEKFEIFIMIDLHTTPGGQNPDWHSDNRTGVPEFWQFGVLRRQTAKLWGEIARRLSHYTYLLGYDLLNEPSMASWEALNDFYADSIAEIRQFDKHHVIVLEGDQFAMDFSGLCQFEDDNLMISFHYYPTVWDKTLLNKDLPRKKRRPAFEEGVARLSAIREQFDRPIICGEAGYDLNPNDMDFCMELLEDTIDAFEKHKVNWAIWTYKDASFMGMVYPKSDTPWMKMATELRKKWTHYQEMEQGRRMILAAAEEFGTIAEETVYQLQFCMRAILYEMQKEKILLPFLRETPFEEIQKSPQSFCLENCERWSCYQALLKQYTAKHSHQ